MLASFIDWSTVEETEHHGQTPGGKKEEQLCLTVITGRQVEPPLVMGMKRSRLPLDLVGRLGSVAAPVMQSR